MTDNELNQAPSPEEEIEGIEVEVEIEAEIEPEDELERLQRELEQAQAQAAEYLDGWQRSQAEFANYRKRQDAARQQQAQYSNANLVAKILPVLDDLQRALQTVPGELQGFTWIDGVLLIKRKLDVVMDSEGVKPIETAGQSFDPTYHEAVTYEETEGCTDGQIIGEIQKGYTLGDRVIRPALVRVACAPQEPSEESDMDSVDEIVEEK